MSRSSVLHKARLEPEQQDTGTTRFKVFTQRDLGKIAQLQRLPEQIRFDMQVVSSVLPFRVNTYVIEQLIDWSRVPEDPIYQLTFPQRDMLEPAMFERMATAIREQWPRERVQKLAAELRAELNPHPAGQLQMNIPVDDSGAPLTGLQHKYRETVLFFPSQGQTCHSYCTFCFRWAQFVGDKSLRMASTEAHRLQDYLVQHPEVSDLLITGGDPMVMKTKYLVEYLEPLLQPRFDHIQTIRIGTKALSFWPQRFVSDADADDLIGLLARLVRAGKHVAIMAHYNHCRATSVLISRQWL